MPTTVPLLIVALAALAGAAVMARSFTRSGRGVGLGAGVGAIGGVLGALLLMVPLNFCTFEAERDPIDVVVGILLIVIGMALALYLARWITLRLLARQQVFAVETQPGAFKGTLIPLLLLAPTLIILLLFLYYPVFDTFSLSVLLARLGIPRTAFVCVDNFTRLINGSGAGAYHQVVLITLLISAAIVVIGLVLALLIAQMAYMPLKGAKIYRTLLIWPYAISPAIAGIIFLLFFNASGLVNYVLQSLTGARISWLTNADAARAAIIIASVWKSLGFNILFYIAGLQNVPNDLKEAASIDGANAFQRFMSVTMPLLSPITFFLIITNTTYAFFETFGTIDYLTGGGPLDSTTTIMYNIYELGFTNNDLGKAAAQSIVLFIMVIGLTVVQFRTAGRRVNYGA